MIDPGSSSDAGFPPVGTGRLLAQQRVGPDGGLTRLPTFEFLVLPEHSSPTLVRDFAARRRRRREMVCILECAPSTKAQMAYAALDCVALDALGVTGPMGGPGTSAYATTLARRCVLQATREANMCGGAAGGTASACAASCCSPITPGVELTPPSIDDAANRAHRDVHSHPRATRRNRSSGMEVDARFREEPHASVRPEHEVRKRR